MEVLRATFGTFIRQAQLQSSRQLSRLAKYQEQLGTGLRVNRPSDDPLAVAPILSTKAALLTLQNEASSLKNAEARLNVSVTSLVEAKNLLVRAKQLVTDGATTLGETERSTLATELQGVFNSLLRVANTEFEGRALYAGNDAEGSAFEAVQSADGASVVDVAYQGGDKEVPWQIDAYHRLTVYHDGAAVFGAAQRGTTLYSGPTGAKAGQGTDSAARRGTLTVTHGTTTYAGSSGVQAGSSSASSDNIIGPTGAHRLTINDTSGTGASGTISLNGGAAIAFTSADTNLAVPGPGGDIVYVNTSAITAGFNGTVDITSTGTLSTDGGATTVPIDFTQNQQVTHSTQGTLSWIDSSNIRRAGTDSVEYRGTSSTFQVLLDTIQDLKQPGGLSEVQIQARLRRSADDLDRTVESITSTFGIQSAALEGIELALQQKKTLQEGWTQRLSDLESADLSEAAIKVKEQENLLQYTYSITARVSQLSLLDYLR